MKILVIVALMIILSGIFTAFPMHQPETTSTEPLQVEKMREPPENATIIQDSGSIVFHVFLDLNQITVARTDSVNISVRIYSTEEADLLLTVGTEHCQSPLAPAQPELPVGITAQLDQSEIIIEPDSEVATNLEIAISSEAISGTYKLKISATQSTGHGSLTASAPLELHIPK